MTSETQKSVGTWSLTHHPNILPAQVLKDLTEELAELAVAMGVVSADELCAEIRRVYKERGSKPKNEEQIKSGIADVQIILYALAEQRGLSVQQCIDEKMAKNRECFGS